MIKKCDWDTNFFKKEIGEINNVFDTLENLDNFDLIYLKTSVDKEVIITNFTCTLKEERHIFEKKTTSSEKNYQNIYKINETSININDIYNLALESGKYSRFKLDPNFSKSNFKEMYVAWVNKTLDEKEESKVFIFKNRDKAIGFITYRIDNNIAWVDLVAVNALYHGKGIGSLLLKRLEFELYIKKIKKIRIATQAVNKNACNFYTKNNYKIIDTIFIKHFWKNDTI